jgi:hypothetical protein
MLVNDSRIFNNTPSQVQEASATVFVSDDLMVTPSSIAAGDQVGSFRALLAGGAAFSPSATAEAGHPGVLACKALVAAEAAALEIPGLVAIGATPLQVGATVRVLSISGTSVAAGVGTAALTDPVSLTARAQIVAQPTGWLCQSSDGITLTDTLVPATVLNTWADLNLEVTATTIRFSINGAVVATHTGNFTTFAGRLQVGVVAITNGAEIEVDLAYIQQGNQAR